MYFDSVYTIISGDNINEVSITMKKLPANKITLNVSAVKATVDESSVAQTYTETSGLKFSLFNKTQNSDISDFTLQYTYIILGDNDAKPNDTVIISVKDKNNRYTGEEVSVILDDEKKRLR